MRINPKAWSSALLLTLVLGRGAFAQDALPSSWRPAAERFAAQIEADVENDNVGSITVGITRGDGLVWVRSFGWADRQRKVPASAETIYRIGSISKSFTAVALMQAVQRGQIKLDDPVVKYLPEATGFADARIGAAPPTMRQLASHTAGLIREPQLENAAAGPIADWEAKVIASIPTTRFDTVPGARYSYSNIGFGILGLAVSRASGTPFMQLVEDGIFKPIGMNSSTFVIGERLRKNLAVGYANGPDGTIDAELPAREHDGRGYKVPNGGIYSTVGDLARFIALLTGSLGDTVLNPQSRAEMMRVQTPGDSTNGYGLGFVLTTDDAGRCTVGHGGSVAGYAAYLAFNPDMRAGVILLRNYGSGRTNLARAGTLLSELVTSEAQAANVASSPKRAVSSANHPSVGSSMCLGVASGVALDAVVTQTRRIVTS
jgi:CubicO group peptidase (beta-lactamase class C family)